MSDRDLTFEYDDEPCDCGLQAPNGFFAVHAPGAAGCEVNEDGSLREEAPDLRFPIPALPTELLWDDQIALTINLAEQAMEREEVERLARKYERLTVER
jgi:hypothetical protein